MTSEATARARRAATWGGLALVAVAAIVGGDAFGIREDIFGSATPPARAPATGFVAVQRSGKAKPTVLRSQPWWQEVGATAGSGNARRSFVVDPSAIQWRIRWSCDEGVLTVAGAGAQLVRGSCPASGTGVQTKRAPAALTISNAGRWSLRVDQQIDLPLERPPLASMTGARRLASGRLYGIDQKAVGRATFYRLPSGRIALRLSHFYVTPNVDLELRLSVLAAPRSTRQYRSARSAYVASLPITAGSLNFTVPRDVDLARFKSLVVWCPPAKSAYGAATLVTAG